MFSHNIISDFIYFNGLTSIRIKSKKNKTKVMKKNKSAIMKFWICLIFDVHET